MRAEWAAPLVGKIAATWKRVEADCEPEQGRPIDGINLTVWKGRYPGTFYATSRDNQGWRYCELTPGDEQFARVAAAAYMGLDTLEYDEEAESAELAELRIFASDEPAEIAETAEEPYECQYVGDVADDCEQLAWI